MELAMPLAAEDEDLGFVEPPTVKVGYAVPLTDFVYV